MSTILYNWKESRRLNDWKIEGTGEGMVDKDGCLHIRTFNMGPWRRATNAWLKDLELPDDFEVEWTYRNGTETGNPIVSEGAILVFNAIPLALADLFEDPRPYAAYSDLCSYGKMVAYSFGYFRTPYGIPAQLRKLGGQVPRTWGESGPRWVSDDGKHFEQLTVMQRNDEPLTADDRGKSQNYKVRHVGDRIQTWCNDKPVHDWTDEGQYPYYQEPLTGGKMCFRNFNGYIDNYFSDIIVRKL